MIHVCLWGHHAKRMPLSYRALAGLWDGAIHRVTDAVHADLHIFAHVLDVQSAPFEVIEDWRARKTPVVILSEEPFWDTIWTKTPLDPIIYVDTQLGAIPVHQLNHMTSDIFRFKRIPYYLLTHSRFEAAYAERFCSAAARGPVGWGALPLDIGFMFERRPEPFHDVAWPEADLFGLAAWRTRFAEMCKGDKVRRWGRSWEGGPSRFDLEGDWHADKLTRLDRRCRFLGAFENTHYPDYVTEKLFDALACGSVALYFAGPTHRVHEFGLPDGAWINLFGMSPADASRISNDIEDRSEDLHAAQAVLAKLFADAGVWNDERERLRIAVVDALTALL